MGKEEEEVGKMTSSGLARAQLSKVRYTVWGENAATNQPSSLPPPLPPSQLQSEVSSEERVESDLQRCLGRAELELSEAELSWRRYEEIESCLQEEESKRLEVSSSSSSSLNPFHLSSYLHTLFYMQWCNGDVILNVIMVM